MRLVCGWSIQKPGAWLLCAQNDPSQRSKQKEIEVLQHSRRAWLKAADLYEHNAASEAVVNKDKDPYRFS